MEGLRIYHHPDGECAAGKALIVSAVTLGDLVAKPAEAVIRRESVPSPREGRAQVEFDTMAGRAASHAA